LGELTFGNYIRQDDIWLVFMHRNDIRRVDIRRADILRNDFGELTIGEFTFSDLTFGEMTGHIFLSIYCDARIYER